MGQPRLALSLLTKCIKLAPFHAFSHYWLAMALLDRRRPFRHTWHTINEMLSHLAHAERLEELVAFRQLRSFIYLDFHDRIGYERPNVPKPSAPHEEGLLWILGQCTSLSTEELEIILP
ncbi:MAG: hypothetical protein AAGA64_12555 [Bacteroidota bacterium]